MKTFGLSKRVVNMSLISALSFFFLLTIGIESGWPVIHNLDISTFNWWYGHFGEPQMTFKQGFLTSYFTIFAKYFDVLTVVILTLVTALILMTRKYYALSFWLISVVASGGLIGIIFKDVIHRPRPYDHLIADTGYSFPSGHSLASSLLFVIIIFILLPHTKRKYKTLKSAILLLSVICWGSILLSRLYFHAHFITDVFGGVALSIIWVMMFVWLYPMLFVPLCNRILSSNKPFYMITA